ncbi:MAG: bifunctional 5,10-methylenetetrahydrofolate dehydrogenase/5,10-methenyltetrahydrofolate cyclohydrolase [Candidatus Omnitrophota bacterium]
MRLLEGKPIATRIKEELKKRIEGLKLNPVLVSVQAGENAGAEAYARSQKKTAENLGIEYRFLKLSQDTKEQELIDVIDKLNTDKSVNGIILQMPLPAHIDYKRMSNFILPQKDVEGMHPANMGKIAFGQAKILPCTPAAVMELLKETGIDLYGKEAVIVGHSEIVGKPLALLLVEKFATVTICHIGTSQAGKLEEHVRRAQVLIVAVGKAGLIKGEWIRQEAVVIDVGINRVGDKITGDVEFDEASKRAAWITPVPGGVGPLTVTMLMHNLVEAASLQQ